MKSTVSRGPGVSVHEREAHRRCRVHRADGQFNAAPATSADEYNWALVDPGVYAVLVTSYVQTNLPFQLRMEVGPSK
jgi:hypothetical protein